MQITMCLCKWEEELLEHLIPAIRHHRSVGYMNAAQIKRVSVDEKDITRTNMPDTHPKAVECCTDAMELCHRCNWTVWYYQEHERIVHISMNKENTSNHMKITYWDSCKLFSHSKDILEASNWCLREPKEHAKRSRWLGGQLVQQARNEG